MAYYLRFRQKVTGPFTLEQVRDMVRKDAVTPLHLLSQDGKTWIAADRVPGLLQARKRPESRCADESFLSDDPSNTCHISAMESVPDPPVAANNDSEGWYFMKDGKRQGPVDIGMLMSAARSGNIRGHDLVWHKEIGWCAAASAPQLSAVFTPYAASDDNTAPTNSPTRQTTGNVKSKIAAGLLALFLGIFGAHHFYLGYPGWGIFRLLLGILGFIGMVEVNSFYNPPAPSVLLALGYGLSGIFAFIEALLLFFGGIKQDANGIPLT